MTNSHKRRVKTFLEETKESPYVVGTSHTKGIEKGIGCSDHF